MSIKRLKKSSDTFDIEFPADKSFDVVGLGENSVDHLCVVPHFPQIDTKTDLVNYARLPGGQIATALVFLARMGLKTKYIGKVGADEMGRLSLDSIRAEGIDVSAVAIEPKVATRFSVIMIDQQSGERTILSHRDSLLDFKQSELKNHNLSAGRILHLDGSDSAAALYAATRCRTEGVVVSLELDSLVPQCKELVEKADFLITSANFPREFTDISDVEEALRAMQTHCPGFLTVTLGAQGAMALVDDACIRFPGFEVEAVDTTGAGDIFHAGFIYGLLRNWPLKKIMAFANAAAALNCTGLGARAGIRPPADIIRLAGQTFT